MKYRKREVIMNCGNNHSSCDRMNRCGEMPRREMSRREMPTCEPVRPSCEMVRPTCEPVGPSCEMVRPTCEPVRPSCEMVRPTREMVRPEREMVRPSHEMVRPSCESVRPAREMVRPSCEMVKPSCEMRPSHEMVRPSCETVRSAREMVRPAREYTRPSCSCEMPQNECVRPSRGYAAEKEVVENITIHNDCSCQEFMRLNDWFNCTFDKSRREFMGAEKGLMDAKDCIKMGLCYNEKVKEISKCMDEFLESMNETDSCETHHACHNRRNTGNCGCNTTCGCNTNCNNSCMQRCEPMKCDPCMKMRRELNEMLCNLNKVEEESLECTQKAIDKLMEAGQLSKCICELKNKLAKNCYPKC